MRNPVKLFVVEGESRDYRFVNEMTDTFFKGRYSSKIITLPASQNLYMLYKKLQEDDFETDIVEVLRDNVEDARNKLDGIKRQDVGEVYLFFDYDVHQDNISSNMPCGSEIIRKMLCVFNNETENGRLYISYPMVEALYDYYEGECRAFSKCFIPIEDAIKYKELSGNNNPNASRKLEFQQWHDILKTFYWRIQCLFDNEDIDYQWYSENVEPETIYLLEKNIGDQKNLIFILSAFPEFLFDYFPVVFWKGMIRVKKKKYLDCPKIENGEEY